VEHVESVEGTGHSVEDFDNAADIEIVVDVTPTRRPGAHRGRNTAHGS